MIDAPSPASAPTWLDANLECDIDPTNVDLGCIRTGKRSVLYSIRDTCQLTLRLTTDGILARNYGDILYQEGSLNVDRNLEKHCNDYGERTEVRQF